MLYAEIVTIFSIEVYSFFLCAALLLQTSSIFLLCSVSEENRPKEKERYPGQTRAPKERSPTQYKDGP